MIKIYDIKNKLKYLREVLTLEYLEWGKKVSEDELKHKIDEKIKKVHKQLNSDNFCKLILLDDDILVGFISLFPTDGDERQDLTPWYATM